MSLFGASIDYAKEWKSVQQLIEKGSMTSAQTKATDLFESARQRHNSFYTLYGALMLQQIENEYQEEAFKQALARYHAIEPELEAADHALLMLFESRMYEQYKDMNYWTVQHNLHPQEPTDDVAVWDLKLFNDTIQALQDQALAASDILKKTKADTYSHFLTPSNGSGRALRPTLYDIVIQTIYHFDASDNEDERAQAIFENPALYGPAAAFCALTLPEGDSIPLLRNLRLLQELTRFHMADDSALRCVLDEQRLQLIESSALREKTLFREGLEQLTAVYHGKNETAEQGHWYYRQANYWHQLSEQDEEYSSQHKITAYNLCRKGMDIAPKNSEGYASCHNLMASLTHPTLGIVVPETLLPDEEQKVILSHSSLTHVWFRIIPCNEDVFWYSEEKMKELLRRPVLQRWDEGVEDPHDYLPHDTLTTLPALEPGNYLLLASSTADFSLKGNLSWVKLNVSALTLYIEADRMKGEQTGIAIHRKTGQPVLDCDVSLWSSEWKKGKTVESKVADLEMGADGFFTVPPTEGRNLFLKATDGSSVCKRSLSRVSQWEFSAETRCQLFTDRQSYRPGDEVLFTALVYEEVDVNHFRAVPNKLAKIELRDVNYQVVQTIEATTDAFGCISGTFTLGASMLPGRLQLVAHIDDDNVSGSRTINLEAYKQPTFAIRFEAFPEDIALTDTVHVAGAAISYTAVPVQDARIHYVITRAEQPSWRWWYGYGEEKTIARGSLATGPDGTFSFHIPPLYTQENPRLKDRCFRYHIHVDITAIDGETQSQSTSVRIGKPYESKDDTVRPDVMPEGALLWGYQPEKSVEPGDTLRLQWGTRQQEVCVVWFLERDYQVVDKGIWNLSDEQRAWTLPATEEWRGSRATLRLVTYHENQMEELSYTWDIPDPDRQLDISLTTFRDRLTPGQPETWTLHINAHDGTPAHANLLTALYDAALDVYGKNGWTLQPWHTFQMNNHTGIKTGQTTSNGYEPNISYQETESPDCPTLKETVWVSYGRVRNGRKALFARMASANDADELMVLDEEAVNRKEAMAAAPLVGTIAGLQADAIPEVAMGAQKARSTADAEATEEEAFAPSENIHIREDLGHTAFFLPCLRTDQEGNVEISFTAPDLLTEWHFQNLAFTEDLRVGSLTQSVITRKELMVQPNVPRFLRQGDSMAFTAKVSNVSDKGMDIRVRLSLTDARTGSPLCTFEKEQTQSLSLAAGEVKTVTFPVTMPNEVFACTYKIIADGYTEKAVTSHSRKNKAAKEKQHPAYSDGEQGVIPVLTTRTLVTESLSLYANPGEKKSYTLKSLAENVSPTLTHHKLALEYTSTPIWYAIQALPALAEVTDPSNFQLFHVYFANSLSMGLLKRYPQIEEVFRRWAEETPDAFLSSLEKNNDLKQIVLSETPWLLEAQRETADRRRIADFFNTQRAEEALGRLRQQLIERQNSDGSWSWMPDFQSSTYITLSLLRGFSELQQEGCIDLDADTELADAIHRAIAYVDAAYYKEYLEWKKLEASNSTFWNKQRFSPICTSYLFARSGWREVPFQDNTKTSYDYFYAALKRVSHVQDGLMIKALTALIFERNHDHSLATALLGQLQETSLTSDEMGMYWRDNTPGWCWYNAPIETQSMLIQAFYECRQGQTSATAPDPLPLMQQWLLKQKQTTRWDTDVATAHAIYALLLGDGSGQLRADTPKAVLSVGGKKLQASREEAGSGYFRQDWETTAIKPTLAAVTIDNSKNPSCLWGALYWQYFEDMDKVAHSQQGFSVSAHTYKITSEGHLAEIQGPLQVGDRVKVRLRFTVDRDLEYVQVKALRPACFEPVSTHSGRVWNGGLSYYLAVEDAATSLYVDYLSKGDYTVEMDYFVSYPGQFVSGTVTLQCLYAPEFRATFSQDNIKVNDSSCK